MLRHLHTMKSTNAVSVEGKCCLKAGSRMSVGRPVKASAHTVGVSYAIFRRSPLVGMVSPRTNSSTSLSRYPVNRSTVADSSVGVAVEFMRVVFALPLLKGRFCLELPPGLVRLVVHALCVCVHRDFSGRQERRRGLVCGLLRETQPRHCEAITSQRRHKFQHASIPTDVRQRSHLEQRF